MAAALRDDLAGRRVDALAVDEARGGVGALRAAEEQDVRLRPANAQKRITREQAMSV